MMKLLAISISEPKPVAYKGRQIMTGIFKAPVQHKIRVEFTGLADDGQADRANHGGPDKAIYAYTIENYRYWQKLLHKPTMPYGQFGENFTVEGMPDDQIHIGDIFKVGEAQLQVTQPRVPCFKLGIRMDSPHFPAAFMRSGRVGFYLRVLVEGEVKADDAIERLAQDPVRLSIQEAMNALSKGVEQEAVIRKALRIEALSAAWRRDLEKRLSKSSPA